jgi:fructosamine-3-kinase
LILEWLELERVRTRDSASLGRALAALHEHLGPRFGWHRDNWLGKTRQTNAWCDDWLTFLAEQRIGSQLRLAHDNGFTQLAREGALLLQRLQSLLADHAPAPSLLHGDLWSGNAAISQGQPVVFDPACYYGDRESDLAMTRLFGGFDDAFYAAYEEAAPLPAGHQPRCLIYQLYHLLNHLNLFGGGYLSQCRAVIARLI